MKYTITTTCGNCTTTQTYEGNVDEIMCFVAQQGLLDYGDEVFATDLHERPGLTLSDMLDIVEEGRECHEK